MEAAGIEPAQGSPGTRKEWGPGTREGYVYFLREWGNDESPIKIGFSGDITERVRQLRYTTGLDLELLAWFPATLSVERDLHKRFAASRVRGEWFKPTKELLDAIGLVRVLHNEAAA